MVTRQHGFTLMELLIVVLIIGILGALVYPSYTNAMIRSTRGDMQNQMLQIAQALERYRLQNFSYRPIPETMSATTLLQQPYIYGSTVYPIGSTASKARYTISLVLLNNGAGYNLTATPRSAQLGDGELVLDHNGRQCWSKKDTACSSSNNTGTGWPPR